jgi:hypothetical protein
MIYDKSSDRSAGRPDEYKEATIGCVGGTR